MLNTSVTAPNLYLTFWCEIISALHCKPWISPQYVSKCTASTIKRTWYHLNVENIGNVFLFSFLCSRLSFRSCLMYQFVFMVEQLKEQILCSLSSWCLMISKTTTQPNNFIEIQQAMDKLKKRRKQMKKKRKKIIT